MSWIILPAGILIYGLLYLLTKSNTRLGQTLRDSDHQAWRDAVEDKESELAELRQAEPHR